MTSSWVIEFKISHTKEKVHQVRVMPTLISYLTVYFIVIVSTEKGDDFFISLFVTFEKPI